LFEPYSTLKPADSIRLLQIKRPISAENPQDKNKTTVDRQNGSNSSNFGWGKTGNPLKINDKVPGMPDTFNGRDTAGKGMVKHSKGCGVIILILISRGSHAAYLAGIEKMPPLQLMSTKRTISNGLVACLGTI
jgi:hypothetical protein